MIAPRSHLIQSQRIPLNHTRKLSWEYENTPNSVTGYIKRFFEGEYDEHDEHARLLRRSPSTPEGKRAEKA